MVWRWTPVITLLMLALWLCSHVSAQSVLDDALEAYHSSVHRVVSYDVRVCYVTRFLMKQIMSFDGDRPTGIAYRAFRPGESMGQQTYCSRQIWTRTGLRRFERLESPNGENAVDVRVFDGTKTSTLARGQKLLSIRPTSPQTREFVNHFESYESLYRSPTGVDFGGFMHQITLRQQKSATLIDQNGRPHVLVEVPVDPQASSLKKTGWRLLLDPDKGMMPKRIEVYGRATTKGPKKTIEITQFHQPEIGVWVPVAATIRKFANGNVYAESSFTVDVARSMWNGNVDRSLFAIEVEPGYRVMTRQRESFILRVRLPLPRIWTI
jgi:hypothetical protein